MRLHRRTSIVQKARSALDLFLLDLEHEHKLTYGEISRSSVRPSRASRNPQFNRNGTPTILTRGETKHDTNMHALRRDIRTARGPRRRPLVPRWCVHFQLRVSPQPRGDRLREAKSRYTYRGTHQTVDQPHSKKAVSTRDRGSPVTGAPSNKDLPGTFVSISRQATYEQPPGVLNA